MAEDLLLDRDDDTWHPVNTGLSSLNVLTLALSDEDFVFAGTEHGIFRSVEAVVTAVEPDDGSIPGAVKLLGNYPNPFSVQTTITFSVNEAGHGELVVYDVNGRMVAKLHDGPLAPGAHRATWDALGQPSGVYFYRLVTDGAIRTGRMVVLRSRN